jgi:hypothetical protein
MSLPNFPVEGGCQCGAVRYRLTHNPLSVYNCHCKDCQRFSGAAWSMSMLVRDEDFAVLQGQTEQYAKRADSGRVVEMHFCAHCHGWLFNRPPFPGIVVVRAGTLDDLDWAAPVGNIWTGSKAAWVEIDPELVNFSGQANDRQPLYDAWTHSTRKDN